MRRFVVLVAPSLQDDVADHVSYVRGLEERGEIRAGFAESWFSMFEETLVGLQSFADCHPYAPERQAWGRDVRNALFAGYRILYLVVGQHVWALRVRHQRQAQLRRPGPGKAYAQPR